VNPFSTKMFRHLLRSAIALQKVEINDDWVRQPNASLLLSKEEITVRWGFEQGKIASFRNLARVQLG